MIQSMRRRTAKAPTASRRRRRTRGLSGAAKSVTGHVGLEARPPSEVALEHLQRRRRCGGSAVAAVLDQGADDELGLVGRAVAAPPRLVEHDPVDALLRGPRL